jgi:hypothetical protein
MRRCQDYERAAESRVIVVLVVEFQSVALKSGPESQSACSRFQIADCPSFLNPVRIEGSTYMDLGAGQVWVVGVSPSNGDSELPRVSDGPLAQVEYNMIWLHF